MLMAKKKKKTPVEEEERKEQVNYTPIEDGSYVGVFTVAVGFFLVTTFEDQLDTDFINQYGAIIVLLTASTAAGISRLIRNKKL
eukprot:CAMPEP_0170772754 /NCGR_PEP_ID=MMETSP0733-20121128/8954_1 /TAXON_ID=186038 /ORGANISM="Fragilariopsis kerguelensis, Strain L26-C5" /LENGTH=83 /DNA_ID=CAMNT_0011114987 /DNA_START=141 /DNA_END=392 /DNA_ORIENTATION=-